MLHIYYGDGKGKTTAAMGLALRMLGANKKVQCIQFLKDGDSSELIPLQKLGVDVHYRKLPNRFVDFNDPQMIKDVAKLQLEIFECLDKDVDCIILDEILDAMTLSLLNEGMVFDTISTLKDSCEIVMTGRQPGHKFKQIAAYSTEMKKHKHPYEQGLRARKGVEY